MSPGVPSGPVFSVKNTGRPRMLTGGASMPPWPPAKLPIQTGPPPVPTDKAIVANWGKVSMLAIHTARPRLVGSMREYILTMFSHTIVAADCPDSMACLDGHRAS